MTARAKPRPDPTKAHPAAAALMAESFFWDSSDSNTPFGSQMGYEVFPAFVRWRASKPTASVHRWVRRKVGSFTQARDQWNIVDPDKVAAMFAGPKGFDYDFRDQIVLAGAFAQLVVDGRIDEDVRQMALTSIARQSTPAGIDLYRPEHQAERAQRLTAMEAVLKAAPG